MTMRKLMIAAAAASGVVAIGYGALAIGPGELRAAAGSTPQGDARRAVDGESEAVDIGRQRPRECDRLAGIDRDCSYM